MAIRELKSNRILSQFICASDTSVIIDVNNRQLWVGGAAVLDWSTTSGGSSGNGVIGIKHEIEFDTGAANAYIRTKNGTTQEGIIIESGSPTGAASGDVYVRTGASDTLSTGNLYLTTSATAAADQNSGGFISSTGDVTGSGASGLYQFIVGSSVDGPSGGILLQSGNTTGTGTTGVVSIGSGSSNSGGTGDTGNVNIGTGSTDGPGVSGTLTLSTGDTPGTSGNIVFHTGVDGVQGDIVTDAPFIRPQSDAATDLGTASVRYGNINVNQVQNIPGSLNLLAQGGQIQLMANATTSVDLMNYGGTAAIPLRFYDNDNSNYVAFRSAGTVASNVTWTWPATDGSANQVLQTNGTGTLSWTSTTGSTFADNVFRVFDNGDNTKQIALEASGITTATTRTITMGDADVNLSLTTSGSFATHTLNNLASVAINSDLVFGSGVTGVLKTFDPASNIASTTLSLASGNVIGISDSGAVSLKSGAQTGAGSANTGTVTVASGNTGGGGTTGNVSLVSGNSTSGSSGNVLLTVGSGSSQGVFKFLKSGVASVSGQVWTASSTDGTGYWATATGGTTFADNTFRIYDNGDNTKLLAFEISGVSTATTRTITMANSNIDLNLTVGGSYANATLSNLGTTAINADLTFDTGTNTKIQTKDDSATTQQLRIQTGNSGSVVSGPLFLKTGTGNAGSGDVLVQTGTVGTGASSGLIQMVSGGITSGTGTSGQVDIATGTTTSSGSNSGVLSLSSGYVTTGAGNSGDITIQSGSNGGTGNSGAMSLTTGSTVDGNSGVMTLRTELASGAGLRGEIHIEARTLKIYGDDTIDQGFEQIILGKTGGNGSETGFTITTSIAGPNNTSDAIDIQTGDGISGGNTSSGGINLGSNTGDVNSGAVSIYSGSSAGTSDGQTGSMTLSTGTVSSGNGQSGNMSLTTGNAASGVSGAFTVTTGASSGATGSVSLVTGASGGSNSGSATIITGDVSTGGASSGGITLQSGNASGAGATTGQIQIIAGVASGGALRNPVDINADELRLLGDNGSTAPLFLRFFDQDESNHIALRAANTIATDFTLILPAADGSNGQFLKTNGSGALSFATAVGSLSAIGSTPNANGATITGSTLNLEPANASFGGVLTTAAQQIAGIKTFTASRIELSSSNGRFTTPDSTGTSFAVFFKSGDVTSGSGSSGNARLKSGDTITGDSGTVIVTSGTATSANSGSAILESATVTSGSSGTVQMLSGDASANSGGAAISTGNSSGGNSGDILLTVGTATGTQGAIKFLKSGVPAVSGYVWTASATDGTGYWAAATGGGSAAGPSGAVQFSDGSGGFLADDTNFHWDDTNNRIGIGTNTPNETLEVAGAIRATGGAGTNVANAVDLDFGSGARLISRGADNATAGAFTLQLVSEDISVAIDRIFTDATTAVLKDSSNAVSLDWENRTAYDSTGSQTALNYNVRQLYDTGNTKVMEWQIQQLYDNSATLSLDWGPARILYANDGTTNNLDWSTPQRVLINGGSGRSAILQVNGDSGDGQIVVSNNPGASSVSGWGMNGSDGEIIVDDLTNDASLWTNSGRLNLSASAATGYSLRLDQTANQALFSLNTLPAGDNSIKLGDVGARWSIGYLSQLNHGVADTIIMSINGALLYDSNANSADSISVNFGARVLQAANQKPSMDWEVRRLYANDGTTINFEYSSPGVLSVNGALVSNGQDPVSAQDLTTKNYVDALVLSGGWTKYTVTAASLATAALTNSITLFSLPAKGTIHEVVIKHTTAFSGTGITDYTISVGPSGSLTKYASAFDVFTATSNTNFQTSSSFGMENFGAGTNILITATSTGANLNAAGIAGSVDVYVRSQLLP